MEAEAKLKETGCSRSMATQLLLSAPMWVPMSGGPSLMEEAQAPLLEATHLTG